MKTLGSGFLAVALLAGAATISAPAAFASPPGIGVAISVGFAPPALPVYVQPVCPGDGYIWTPGYWAYSDVDGYYWVPGTWVLAPQVGFLWTPPYWAFLNGAYIFHEGYWGPHVGFYGGVAYGFGYFGHGFVGGRWEGSRFFYNRAVSHVNVTVTHNTYNTHVREVANRVSYNGGPHGINARATAAEERAANERHEAAVAAQTQHIEEARANRDLRATANHGKPPIAATAKPAEFRGNGAIAARAAGGTYHAPPPTAARAADNRAAENHSAEDRAAADRAAAEKREADNRAAENRKTEEARAANDKREADARAANEKREAANRAATEKQEAASRAAESRARAVHPKDLPPAERAPAPNTGNAKLDKKYTDQQNKLAARQAKDSQKLQQRQDKEHQQLAKQHANEQRQQQVEPKHQQQTEHMAQQHAAQQQKMRQRQQPPPVHNAGRPGGKPERP